MKAKLLLTLITLLLPTSFALSFEVQPGNLISDATYLRKLSLSLRGIPATRAEYLALEQAADTTARKAVLDTKLREYLGSREHREKMIFRMSEMLQLRPPRFSSLIVNRIEPNYSGSMVTQFRDMNHDSARS